MAWCIGARSARGRSVRRRGRAKNGRAACMLLGGALLACGNDTSAATQPERFPALALHLPALGCFDPVVSGGNCARDGDCAAERAERCVLAASSERLDRAPVTLTCGEPVGTRAAAERCELGRECESGLCALAGVCVAGCRVHDDCASGWQCRPLEVRLSREALAPVMACARTLVLPDDVRLMATSHATKATAGRQQLAIAGTRDPAIVFVQGPCPAGLELSRVRSNDLGRDLFVRGVRGAENPVLHDGSSLAVLLFPNNPALTPSATGLTLSIRLADPRRGLVEQVETVVASRGAGASSLDLNVFYVGGGGSLVDGGFTPGEPRVAKLLGALDQRLGTIGMSLGTVREYDVVGALREELSVLEVPRRKVNGRVVEGKPLRLDELFALSAGVDDPGINVFLVSDMGSYVGIAGGIPGLLGVHGTARSGVALATDMLGDLAGADVPLLHEIGHFLGLFHTVESNGTVLDPLADTEDCLLANDADRDRELASAECEGKGADNLMFWSGAGTRLTPDQIRVMAAAVVLR